MVKTAVGICIEICLDLVGEISGSHCGDNEDDSLSYIAPCSLAEVGRRFRSAYFLHRQGALMVEAVSTSETSANF
jgi:hypothetical protein